MSFRCDRLDGAIAEEVLKALQHGELELALVALEELESRDQTLLRQWQIRLERAEYEAVLAERRYQEVDPSQRLMASTPEHCWNDARLHLENLKAPRSKHPSSCSPHSYTRIMHTISVLSAGPARLMPLVVE